MKRSFSREYWFLLSSWVVFTLLGRLFGLLSEWVWKGEPEFLNRCTSPSDAASIIGSLFLELSRAFPVLAGAVLGIVVIRYWVLPCGVLFFLQWLRIFCFSLSSTVNSGLLKVVWTALTPALSLVLLFWAAKGLYLLYRGREWAVALTFVLLNFLIGLIGLLLTLGSAGNSWSWKEHLLGLVENALLSGAAYALLYCCLRSRWFQRLAAEPETAQDEK